jgi:UDP-N-acetylglucosamine--N-acetylmuramyl-(pentapeptide) pyrophosphoryl-undecaprenol N-acetylglucosamine transferase
MADSPKSARVVLVGGGTAGHIMPCVAVAEALQALRPDVELLFIGADRPGDRAVFEGLGLRHGLLAVEPFPYCPSLAMLRAYAALRRARARAREVLADFGPASLFSSGSYVAGPVIPEARALGVPVVLHAADAMPGRANVALARYADVITVAYELSRGRFRHPSVVWSGQPIRRSVLGASRESGRERLGIPPTAAVLLAYGGGQGAASINGALLDALPQLLEIPDLWVVHLTGPAHIESVRAATRDLSVPAGSGYQCHAFLDQPGDAIAAADLVVSRCGSSSMAEIAALGRPCIAIPYPHAGGHQKLNALPLVDAGGAVLLEDRHLSGATLGGWVVRLLGDSERLVEMAKASQAVGKPEAADTIAQLIAARLPSPA